MSVSDARLEAVSVGTEALVQSFRDTAIDPSRRISIQLGDWLDLSHEFGETPVVQPPPCDEEWPWLESKRLYGLGSAANVHQQGNASCIVNAWHRGSSTLRRRAAVARDLLSPTCQRPTWNERTSHVLHASGHPKLRRREYVRDKAHSLGKQKYGSHSDDADNEQWERAHSASTRARSALCRGIGKQKRREAHELARLMVTRISLRLAVVEEETDREARGPEIAARGLAQMGLA